jgi:lipopolysaccharide export system permease protein
MIFRRALLREFTQTAVTVFIALFAILLTTQLIRLLNEAAGGKLASQAVVALLGFGAINYLPVVLSVTVFVSILLTLSRWYRDSEMIVWFSSGLPLTAWIGPVVRFTLPLVVAIAALSLFLSPWALTKSAEFRQRMDTRDDVSNISPGVFNEASGAERVFFVEGMNGANAGNGGRVKNIFVSSVQSGRLGVMAAAQGHTEVASNGDRFLVMENGRRYEGMPGNPEYRVMEFSRYAVRIEPVEARGIEKTPGNLPLKTLVRNPTLANLGEIVWRTGIPVAALVLALLAIPLSFVNPRAGRTTNLIFAILIYMIYNNLISVSQAWVRQGKMPFELGMWGVHAAMLVLLLALFWHRLTLVKWWRLWK